MLARNAQGECLKGSALTAADPPKDADISAQIGPAPRRLVIVIPTTTNVAAQIADTKTPREKVAQRSAVEFVEHQLTAHLGCPCVSAPTN